MMGLDVGIREPESLELKTLRESLSLRFLVSDMGLKITAPPTHRAANGPKEKRRVKN